MTTQAMTTTYVTYKLPGAFMPEETTREVTSRDLRQTVKDAPSQAYAFQYFDVVIITVEINGERVETKSEHRNVSKTYYIDAKLITAKQAIREYGENSPMHFNIEANGWEGVVLCRTGNYQPFKANEHELVSSM